MLFLRLFFESIRFAGGALKENLLRTVLSLLGVTIGIFSIISVLTVVDALETSVKRSLSFLGSEVVYVAKWPWIFSPTAPWWKFVNRPQPTYEEYEFLNTNLTKARAISIYDVKSNALIKYRNNSIGSIFIMGASYSHFEVGDFEIAKGRFYSPAEADRSKNVVVIGNNVAEALFPNQDPIGKTVKIKGIKFAVIGVMQRKGENLLGAPSNDELCVIPYWTMVKMYATASRGISPEIAMKGFPEDKGLVELEGQARGLLRSFRGLRPIEDDNFALNRPEAFAEILDNIIGALTVAGWCIGSFSILVGGFGIANIMFVSVKERTNLIGIQKSLGAKNYFILLQFLFEAVFLSLIGGAAGLLMVSMITVFSTESFIITLNWKNIFIGTGVSLSIGMISGIVPAVSASRMDPVIAIRSK